MEIQTIIFLSCNPLWPESVVRIHLRCRQIQFTDTWHENEKPGEFILAATKQLYEWFCLSVRPSVCPLSICLSHLFDNFPLIVSSWIAQEWHKAWRSIEEASYCFSKSSIKFQDPGDKKSSILTPIGRFQTVTPVLIHWWLWNDAQSLM